MSKRSKYWTLVQIDGFGNCQIKLCEEVKAFFDKYFPEQVDLETIRDRSIQYQLMQWYHSEVVSRYPLAPQVVSCQMAELCLRCFISNEMYQICLTLSQQFGKKHDFTSADILPLLLDRTHCSHVRNNTSLTTKILTTFDPDRSNLSTWTTRMVKSDREFKRFLLSRGMEQVTDWLILNQLTPGRLREILCRRTEFEIAQWLELLESYHQVYRSKLISQRAKLNKERQQQGKGKVRRSFPQPTNEQLGQIADLLSTSARLSPGKVLSLLQYLARLARKYRIYKRTGNFPDSESLDKFNDRREGIRAIIINNDSITDGEDELKELFQPVIYPCLVKAVELVIQARVSYQQQRRKPQQAEFLKALHLFHCQGVCMGQIAPLLGWEYQYQVTRLLELKKLRKDIGRKMLVELRDRFDKLAQKYRAPDSLCELEQQIQNFLEQQINTVIKEAEREASTSKNRKMCSQLSHAICQYLRQLPVTSDQ